MGPTITAAVAALLGVVIGSLLNRNTEYRKWLRSEQHSSCTRLLQSTRRTYTQWIVWSTVREMAERKAKSQITTELVRGVAKSILVEKYPAVASLDSAAQDALIDEFIAEEESVREKAVRRAVEHAEKEHLETPYLARLQEVLQEVAAAYTSVTLVCDSKVVEKARALHSSVVTLDTARAQGHAKLRKRYKDAESEFIQAVRSSIGPASPKMGLNSLFQMVSRSL